MDRKCRLRASSLRQHAVRRRGEDHHHDEYHLAPDDANGRTTRREVRSRRSVSRPKQVARFTADELQRDVRLGYRAKSIHALASGIADGSIDLEAIADPRRPQESFLPATRSCRESDPTAPRICWQWTAATTSSPSTPNSAN